MNREIKYRAFYKPTKQMFYSYDATNDSIHDDSREFYPIGFGIGFKQSWKIGDFELMQFTGLTSIDGKDIYEGDVIELNNSQTVIHWTGHGFNGVYYNGDGTWDDEWEDGIHNRDKIKVLGNIYENPSLLELLTT